MPEAIAPELTNAALDAKDSEIASLRAELDAVQAATKTCRDEAVQDIIRLKVAARHDAEEIARLKEVLKFAATFEITDSNGDEVCEDSLQEVRKSARAVLAPHPSEGTNDDA